MRSAAEIQREIEEISTALSQIRKGGQSWTISSGAGSGTSRTVTMADYKTLAAERSALYQELAQTQRGQARRIGIGW